MRRRRDLLAEKVKMRGLAVEGRKIGGERVHETSYFFTSPIRHHGCVVFVKRLEATFPDSFGKTSLHHLALTLLQVYAARAVSEIRNSFELDV